MASANYVKIGENYYAPNHPIALKHLAGLADPQREQNPLPPLVNRKKAHSGRKVRVDLCIKIISIRKREADLDNIISGAKPLRDSVARSLAIDDGDPRIRWEYDTIITSGAIGTQVLISRV